MKYLTFILFLFLSVFNGVTFAASGTSVADNKKQQLELFSSQIKKLSKKLNHGDFNEEDLSDWTKLTIKAGSAASLCSSNLDSKIIVLNKDMEGLGELVKGEALDVTKKRNEYKKQKSSLDKQLAKCNLIKLSSDDAASLISIAESSYFKQKYLAREQDVIVLTLNYLENPVALLSDSGEFAWNKSGVRDIEFKEAVVSTVFMILVFFVSVWLRRVLNRQESARRWHDDFTNKMLRAALTTGACALPYILISAAFFISALIVIDESGQGSFLIQLSLALLIYFSVTAMIRFVFLPYPPAQSFVAFTPEIAKNLSHRLKILAVLGLVGYLAFYTVFSENIQESNLLLLRVIFSTFFVLNIIWTLAVIIRSPRLPQLRWIAYLVIFLLILTLMAEMAGYRNLGFSARRMILYSFLLYVVFIGVAKLLRDVFNKVDEGRYGWGKRLHKTLGVEEGGKIPGLIWLRFLSTVMIWGGFAFLLIDAWDYSGGVIESIRNYLINGFDLGDFRIIPGRMLWAVLLFSLIVILSSWIRSQMENKWLKMTGMNSGARDALVTITGYVLFLIAVLAGLSAAGFDFSNIAIIAGALSVGIGFGLQNIVNNFVSGLILLFERPIRKGDWIVVGGTEGVVKDIQIRSTRIQTFDRSDVIVPNSELISNQVTNWVLSSDSGRAIIPVGVAYGSDTNQVRDILLAIAEENEAVSKRVGLPKPVVLFREFGDSSLNFELRVFLHNVGSRLGVVSDLNFAIDKAFREANIEIPFPQRDVNVRKLPDTNLSGDD